MAKAKAMAKRRGKAPARGDDGRARKGARKAGGAAGAAGCTDAKPGGSDGSTRRAAPPPQGTLRTVLIRELHASPDNPRAEAGLAATLELAASIRANGLLQPLLVRPRTRGGGFEVVAGNRRLVAIRSQVPELVAVPCIVADLDDRAARTAAIVENLQREDVAPLDEAEAFERLRSESGWTVAAIGEAVGRPPAYVAGRLALRRLPKAAKAALASGSIGVPVALLVARIGDPEARERATKIVVELARRGAVTFATAAEEIDREVLFDLRRAPFKLDDATLVPEAGACIGCPFHSGSDPDLFGDVKGSRCTRPSCYHAKADVHFAIESKRLVDSTGATLLSKAEQAEALPRWSRHDSGPSFPWVALDEKRHAHGKAEQPVAKLIAGKPVKVRIMRTAAGAARLVVNEREVGKLLAGKRERQADERARKATATKRAKITLERAHRDAVAALMVDRVEGHVGAVAGRTTLRYLVDRVLAESWAAVTARVVSRRNLRAVGSRGQADDRAIIAKLADTLGPKMLLALALELLTLQAFETRGLGVPHVARAFSIRGGEITKRAALLAVGRPGGAK